MKNIMTKVLLLAGLLLFISDGCISAQNQAKVITLEQAIKMAVTNHPLIKEARSQVAVAKAKTAEENSAFYPTAAVNLVYTRISPVPFIKLPFPGGGEFHMAPANNYNESLGVQYLIYDFKRRKDLVKLLQSNEVTEEEKINVIKNQLAYQTAEIYYTLVYLQKSVGVLNKQIKDLKVHLEVAKKMVATGAAIGLDTLNTKVRVITLENQKQSLYNQWQKTAVVLKSLMNIPAKTQVKIKGNFPVIPAKYSVDSLVQTAFQHREELKLNHLANRTLNIQKQIISKSMLPILRFQGEAGFKNGYPDNLNKLKPNFAAGITATIPIFNGYLRRSKLLTANMQIESLHEENNVLKHNIRTSVHTSLLDYENNLIQIKSALAEMNLAKAALKQAKGLYRSGSITNTTLLDNETAVSAAKMKYITDLFKITLSHLKLLQATGQRIW